MSETPDPLLVYWHVCEECNYEAAAHGRVQCGECGGLMSPHALAGAILDERGAYNSEYDQEDLIDRLAIVEEALEREGFHELSVEAEQLLLDVSIAFANKVE